MSDAPRAAAMDWRLLETIAAPGAWQMALDEALLLGVGGDERPTLRFYRFDPPALSLGWFQRLDEVPLAASGVPVVRRLTGGGAIHHGDELTFAIAAPADHPLYRGPVGDSYARVHAAIADALARFDVSAEPRGSRALASDAAGTGMCFRESAAVDLVWQRPDGTLAKGVGSAQRRRGGRVLHHGSIKLGADARELAVAVARDAGGAVDASSLGQACLAAFARAFDARFTAPVSPLAAERASADERAPAFADPARLGGRARR